MTQSFRKNLDQSGANKSQPFFELGMQKNVDKLRLLYDHLNRFEKMKQVTVKNVLVFLKVSCK